MPKFEEKRKNKKALGREKTERRRGEGDGETEERRRERDLEIHNRFARSAETSHPTRYFFLVVNQTI